MGKRSVVPRRRARTRAGGEITRAVLHAARDILEAEGPEALSTNRIAERAGVSVGSLYQYFPNKDAIIAELARWVETESLGVLSRAIEAHANEPYSIPASVTVRGLAGLQLGGYRFRRSVRELVPDGWIKEVSRDVDRKARELLADELERRDDVRDGSKELMAWVALHAVEGVIEAIVWDRPELLEDEELLKELEELVIRYLAPDRSSVRVDTDDDAPDGA